MDAVNVGRSGKEGGAGSRSRRPTFDAGVEANARRERVAKCIR